MKKNYLSLILLLTVFCFGSKAQVYSSWGTATANGSAYDTIFQYNDTLTFGFTGLPLGGYGNARLVIYFEGDFGDNSEYVNAYDLSSSTPLGSSTNTPNGDCGSEDSTIINFPASSLDNWQTLGNWVMFGVPTSDVDLFCFTQRIRVRLEYDYCQFGTPSQFASIIPDTNFVCSHNTTGFTLAPPNGTLVGPGLNGNVFNPAGLSPGVYTFQYTATDLIGCTTSASATVKIGLFPVPQSYLVCEGGDSPVLNGTVAEFAYATDVNFTIPIDTAIAYVYGPITNSPDTIFMSVFSRNDAFLLDTVTNDNIVYIDHDNSTGDDRGGIAITDSSIYIVGDNNTAMFNLDLTSAGVSLPVMDGLFSDLRARKLYTLYNTINSSTPSYNNSNSFSVNSFAELDANLVVTGSVIPLSQTIPMGNNFQQGAMLAGYGKLGLYNGTSLFVVDIASGMVDSIGQFSFNLAGSENWLDWGNLGYNGVDWIAYYKDYNFEQVVSHNLTTDVVTPISQFPGYSDMASFTYHPGNNRFYFHYEGSGHFGGNSETLGYLDATATILTNPNGALVGCPSPISFTFNSLDLGPDTIVCQSNIPYVLEAGFGYGSYTWNGVNNNWNVYPVATTTTMIASVVDASNCVITDTVLVTIDGCLGIGELSKENMSIYPNPNNGTFNILLANSVEELTIEITDTKGRLCHSEKMNGNIQNAKIETRNLEKGIYIVQLKANNVLMQSSIVIQ